MSRIGIKPIAVPAGVEVRVEGAAVSIKGPKGELSCATPGGVRVCVEGGQVRVSRESDETRLKALHGTVRSLLANMLHGVTEGYRKDLEIQGVGYKAAVKGKKIVFNLGYSHPIEFEPPAGVQVVLADATTVAVSGVDKQLVGEVSARIRAFAKAEPYKGKGVRYKGEHVRRKAGKTVA